MKKILSLILSVLIFTSACPVFAFAQNDDVRTEFEDNAYIADNNAFSNVISQALEDENARREEDNGYGIFSVEISDLQATVNLSAPDNSVLVVAVYTQDGYTMLSSGKTSVGIDDDVATVILSDYIQTEYYEVRAFILDENNIPVCKNYVNLENTSKYQEFFEKDTDSFDEELVINLDSSEETNFAVVSQKAVVVNKTVNKNKVISDDYENGKYIIENADEKIKSLASGDIFYYVYGDGPYDYILTKVEKVSTTDGVTIITAADDCELHELFQYIDVDTSNGSSSSVYERAADINVGKDKSFVLNEKGESKTFGDENCSLTLKVTGNVTFHVKFQYDIKLFGKDYWLFEYWLSVDANAKADFQANTSFTKNVVLVDKTFPVMTGLDIAFKLSATVTGSASLSVTGDIVFEMKYGAKQSSSGGKEKIEKKPNVTLDVVVNGDFSIDFTPEIETDFCILKVLYAGFGVNVTFNINGTLFVPTSYDEKQRHECFICVSGDINATAGFTISVKYGVKKDSLDTLVKLELKSKTYTLGEYYLSINEQSAVEFGWGKCPHVRYKVTVTVKDASGKAVADVTVNEEYITDAQGKTEIYLKNGSYTLTAVAPDGKTASAPVFVEDEDTQAVLTFAPYILTVIAKDNTGNMLSGVTVNGEYVTDASGCVCIPLADGEYSITGVSVTGVSVSETVTIDGADKTVELVFFVEEQQIPDSAVRYGNSYYQLYNKGGTWEEAHTFCMSMGGHLAVISDDAENSFLFNYIISLGCKSAYFGYTDSASEGNWEWVNGFTSSYVNWGGREPNAENSYEDYAMFYYKYTDGKWNDGDFGGRTVNSGKYFICEWDLSPDDSEEEYKNLVAIGTFGDNIVWQLFDDGELNINGSGEMSSLSEDGNAPWYDYRNDIRTITFDEDVTSIGTYTFKDCTGLTEIVIPETITKINHGAFLNCSNLVSVTIPENMKSLPSYLFGKCTSLKNVILPEGLEELTASTFAGCTSLESIVLPSGLKHIGYSVFYGCTALKTITIPKGITVIKSNTFDGCTSLVQVSLPDGLVEIEMYAFAGCTSLREIRIPAGLTILGSCVFENCTSLERIVLPQGLKTVPMLAFNNCTALKEVVIPVSVKKIEASFFGCDAIETVYYSGSSDDWKKIDLGDAVSLMFRSAEFVYNYVYESSYEVPVVYNTVAREAFRTETVENTVEGTDYLFVVVRDKNAEDLISSENLLYIDQKTAFARELEFTYNTDAEAYDILVFPEPEEPSHVHTPGEWTVITPAEVGINGLRQLCCTGCGTVLEEEIIPALTDSFIPGDINGDGKITASDARQALRFSARVDIPDEIQMLTADVNGDGKITAFDARKILRVAARIETM